MNIVLREKNSKKYQLYYTDTIQFFPRLKLVKVLTQLISNGQGRFYHGISKN